VPADEKHKVYGLRASTCTRCQSLSSHPDLKAPASPGKMRKLTLCLIGQLAQQRSEPRTALRGSLCESKSTREVGHLQGYRRVSKIDDNMMIM